MKNGELAGTASLDTVQQSLPNPLLTTEGVADGSWEQETLALREAAFATKGQDLMAFFAVGMVINVVVLAAFVVWAFRQWKKK